MGLFSKALKSIGGITKADIDAAQRMAAADEMFPVTAYRGVLNPAHIDQSREETGALWASENAALANDYAATYAGAYPSFITKLRINPEGFLEVNGAGAHWDNIPSKAVDDKGGLRLLWRGEDISTNDLVAEARRRGLPGVVFRDVVDDAASPKGKNTNYAVIDKSRRRASTAAFDPAKKDSSDLLAALPYILAGGGLLSAMQRKRANAAY